MQDVLSILPPMIFTAFLVGYLIGSVPFGFVLGYLCGLGDIRAQGSGNIGATNMLRVGNKMLAVFTLLFDMGKGVLAVYVVQQVVHVDAAYIAALAAVIGHMFPMWLGFKGGKGVATTLGVLTMLHWPLGVFLCLAWLFVFTLTKISSLSALVAMFLAPVFAYLFATSSLTICSALLAALVIAKHHENVRRLLNGGEHSFRS